MIKLIASDMDGTLLDDDSKVPEETFELIHALHENNLPFINGGENVPVAEIPTTLSLLVVLMYQAAWSALSIAAAAMKQHS